MKKIRNLLERLIMVAIALSFAVALPAQDMISDDRIQNRVERELLYQADVPAYLIDTEVREGIVQLSGSVGNIMAKERAVRVATAVRGVKGVINQIKVMPEPRTDAAVEQDIEEALAGDPATSSLDVETSVINGVVTLTGTADSWSARRLSGYVAQQVDGVRELKNEIDVVANTDRPDAEIAQEIRRAIQYDIRLHQSTVNVQVKEGRVKLTGAVGSVNARNLAENYAWTAGVTNVDSKGLEVADWAGDPNLKKKMYPDLSDSEIKSAIETAFIYDPRVNSFNPNVKVEGGIVTLTGEVDNLIAKRSAEADAQNVVGVMYVYNHLKVRPEAIPLGAELATSVKEALLRDSDTHAYEIMPSAKNGTVTLRGTVDSYFEKYEAENIASRVNGVVAVNNKLKVESNEGYPFASPYPYYPIFPSPYMETSSYYSMPLTDEQIKDNIDSELWWSPFVDADEVHVNVEGGVATLTGTVDTWQERSSAVENAFEGGAEKVVDLLIVGQNKTR